MKWQQRVRVATGLSCWQIMLHLLVVAVLVMGWMSGTLVRVGRGYASFTASPCCRCCFYSATMTRWREVGDVLEELTTTGTLVRR